MAQECSECLTGFRTAKRKDKGCGGYRKPKGHLDSQLYPECEGSKYDRDVVKKTREKRKKKKNKTSDSLNWYKISQESKRLKEGNIYARDPDHKSFNLRRANENKERPCENLEQLQDYIAQEELEGQDYSDCKEKYIQWKSWWEEALKGAKNFAKIYDANIERFGLTDISENGYFYAIMRKPPSYTNLIQIRQLGGLDHWGIDPLFLEEKSMYIPSQNKDPNSPKFEIDMSQKYKRAIPPQAKRNINDVLHYLGTIYHKEIPFDTIENFMLQNDVVIVQEDGTLWSGFIAPQGECGSDKANNAGPMKFDLAVKVGDHYQLSKNMLIMTLCTMPSGKIELVAYLS